MFYVSLWLFMMTAWITLLVWGMTMETLDRKRAGKASKTLVEHPDVHRMPAPVPA
jgi:hypothetical protein